MKKIFFGAMVFIFLCVFLKEFFIGFENFYPYFISLGLGILIFSVYFFAKGMQRSISLLCFTISLLLLSQHFDTKLLYKSLEKSVGIICIFTVIPLLTFPIEKGDYSHSIKNFVSRFSKNNKFIFTILSLFHWILTIILNIPSIPIMQEIIQKNNFSKKYLTRMYTAGYCCFMIFSPYDGLLNMILIMYSVKHYQYFPYALLICLFIVGLSSVLLSFYEKEVEEEKNQIIQKLSSFDKKKIFSLVGNIIFLIFVTILGDYMFTFKNPMLFISLIVVGYSLFWSFQNANFQEYKTQFKSYIERTTNFGTIIVFLISTNCLGEIIQNTSIGEIIEKGFLKIMFLPSYFLILTLILFTVALALVGVHMLIPVAAILMIVKPEFLGIAPASYPLVVMCCWISAMSISPFVPFPAVVAQTIDEDILKVTFKYNKIYSILLILLCPAMILLLNKIL